MPVSAVHTCVCTAGCADLMTLDTMTPQERKRQGYIHELIQTEETYVEDLELVLEVKTVGCLLLLWKDWLLDKF